MKGLRTHLLLVPALVFVAFFGRTLPANADFVDDWFAHNVAGLERAAEVYRVAVRENGTIDHQATELLRTD